MDDGDDDEYVPTVVLVFALVKDRLREAGIESNTNEVGRYHLQLPRTWSDGRHLRAHLCKVVWPTLADIEPIITLALNMCYLNLEDGNVQLSANDTIALIPPITGG